MLADPGSHFYCSLSLCVIPFLCTAYVVLSKFFVHIDFGYMDYVNERVKRIKEIVSNINTVDISILITQGDKRGVFITQVSSFSGTIARYFDIPLKCRSVCFIAR